MHVCVWENYQWGNYSFIFWQLFLVTLEPFPTSFISRMEKFWQTAPGLVRLLFVQVLKVQNVWPGTDWCWWNYSCSMPWLYLSPLWPVNITSCNTWLSRKRDRQEWVSDQILYVVCARCLFKRQIKQNNKRTRGWGGWKCGLIKRAKMRGGHKGKKRVKGKKPMGNGMSSF